MTRSMYSRAEGPVRCELDPERGFVTTVNPIGTDGLLGGHAQQPPEQTVSVFVLAD